MPGINGDVDMFELYDNLETNCFKSENVDKLKELAKRYYCSSGRISFMNFALPSKGEIKMPKKARGIRAKQYSRLSKLYKHSKCLDYSSITYRTLMYMNS